MKIKNPFSKSKDSKISINRKSDKIVTAILITIVLYCYFKLSLNGLQINIYLFSLIWYLVAVFYVLRVRIFSGIGLYIVYLFCFVQLGILMQGIYFSFDVKVINIIAIYNFVAPFIVWIFSKIRNIDSTTLKEVNISDNWVTMLFLAGLSSIFLYFLSVGSIPLFAEDAENFRVQAIGGKGFLVIIAASCFKISIAMTSKDSLRAIRMMLGVLLLLGTGYRSQALEIILIIFLIFWVGKGKKYIAKGIVIIIFLGFSYSLIGVIRSGIEWHWETLYKPMLWRFYVNTYNFNTVLTDFPKNQLQYGLSFFNDISVLLPGAQTTFMTQLKDIMGMNFSGGSLTPSVFGEGYYNWGVFGAIVWPIIVLLIVLVLDNYNKEKIDGKAYYAVSFALVGFSTTSLIPVMINAYLPLLFVYLVLSFVSKKYKLKFN